MNPVFGAVFARDGRRDRAAAGIQGTLYAATGPDAAVVLWVQVVEKCEVCKEREARFISSFRFGR